MKKWLLLILSSTILVSLILSCSTKKNTWASRQYHNLTARFNVNFNAKESLKEADKKVEAIYPKTFDEILPVFAFLYPNAPEEVSFELERTITKSNTLIAKHSITAKPKRKGNTAEDRKFYNQKEFNNMVDDAYLYIGKAKMYMHLFDEAFLVFESISLTYPNQNTKYENQLWLAFANFERGYPEQTQEILAKLAKAQEKDIDFPRNLLPQINALQAHIHIKNQEYEQAIPYLTKSLDKTSKKNTKVRYTFILGQLYERTGNRSMATSFYNKVAKMNVPYEVRFAALMKVANTMDNLAEEKELEKLYKKMLADKENQEFADQLYFALGNLAKKQGDNEQAYMYYRKSIEAYDGNDTQKGLSSLTLANLALAQESYVNAFNYADSASQLLNGHVRYQEASDLSARLKTLAKNLAIVQQEDSLQNIANMSNAERQKFSSEQAAAFMAKERATQETVTAPVNSIFQANIQQNRQSAQGRSSQWYFYNSSAMNQGAADFKMRWGQRKLEDNWRRKNKSSVSIAEATPEEEPLMARVADSTRGTNAMLTPKDAGYYLRDVPLTEEAINASNALIEKALFGAAVAFRNDLKNNQKSLETFEELLRRFPNSPDLASIYFNMYSIYVEEGNMAKATAYKERLQTEFPNEKYTLSILNPNYLAELQNREKAAEERYNEALALYRAGNNAAALALINQAVNEYKGTEAEANFALLAVLATSHDGNITGYKQALKDVATAYPSTGASKTALAIIAEVEKNKLRLLAGSTNEQKSTSTSTDEGRENRTGENTTASQSPTTIEGSYTFNENEEHVVLIVFNSKAELNQHLFDIAVFNAENYLDRNYNFTEEKDIDASKSIVVIQSFKNKREVMDYYNDLLNRASLFKEINPETFVSTVISKSNLEVLRRSKSIADYIQFFKKYYTSADGKN